MLYRYSSSWSFDAQSSMPAWSPQDKLLQKNPSRVAGLGGAGQVPRELRCILADSGWVWLPSNFPLRVGQPGEGSSCGEVSLEPLVCTGSL